MPLIREALLFPFKAIGYLFIALLLLLVASYCDHIDTED